MAREQHYIDTLNPEYNILRIAGSRLGSKQSPDTIAAQKEQMVAKLETPQWEAQLRNMTAGVIAYMNDPETKQKYRTLREGKTFEEIMGEQKAVIARAKQVEAKAKAKIKCHAAVVEQGRSR